MIHLNACCVLLFCSVKTRQPPNRPHNSHIHFPSGCLPPTPTVLFQVSPSDLYEALAAAAVALDSDGKLVETRGAVNVLAVVDERERSDGVGGGGGGGGINWWRG